MAEQVPLSGIRAVVFDKDGTLIDVHRTWGPAMAGALRDLVDDPTRRSEAAAAIGVDLDTHELSVDAPIIAASNDQIVAILAPILDVDPERFLPIFEERLFAHADGTVTPLSGVSDARCARLDGLLDRARHQRRGDVSASAAHRAWWLHRFESVIGYDSGFGAKPGSGMLLESAERAGVKPQELVLVGDTDTDLRTAAAAGCPSVLVHAPVGSIQPTVHLASLAELPALLA